MLGVTSYFGTHKTANDPDETPKDFSFGANDIELDPASGKIYMACVVQESSEYYDMFGNTVSVWDQGRPFPSPSPTATPTLPPTPPELMLQPSLT